MSACLLLSWRQLLLWAIGVGIGLLALSTSERAERATSCWSARQLGREAAARYYHDCFGRVVACKLSCK